MTEELPVAGSQNLDIDFGLTPDGQVLIQFRDIATNTIIAQGAIPRGEWHRVVAVMAEVLNNTQSFTYNDNGEGN